MKQQACFPRRYDAHFAWLSGEEVICLLGFAVGRVSYEPEGKWLYSLRLFLGLFKLELNWTTGHAA